MSTPIYDAELYTDIWEKHKLIKQLEEQIESVRNQISGECDLIEFHFCGVEICLDYNYKELSIIV